MARVKVRSLRHWKQRFNKDAEFIWRRPIKFAGKMTKAGDAIPKILADNPNKLRRFWESGTIELAQFEEPKVGYSTAPVHIAKAPVLNVPPVVPAGIEIVEFEDGFFHIYDGDDAVEVEGQAEVDAWLLEREAAEAAKSQEDKDLGLALAELEEKEWADQMIAEAEEEAAADDFDFDDALEPTPAEVEKAEQEAVVQEEAKKQAELDGDDDFLA